MTLEKWWDIMLGVNVAFEVGAIVAIPEDFSVRSLGAIMLFFFACVLILFFTYPRSPVS